MSADTMLGVPFNVSFYAILTNMLARVVNMAPLDLHMSYGDAHIYVNHTEQVDEQLSRTPLDLPTLDLPNKKSVLDYVYEDIVIGGYVCCPPIKAKVAV